MAASCVSVDIDADDYFGFYRKFEEFFNSKCHNMTFGNGKIGSLMIKMTKNLQNGDFTIPASTFKEALMEPPPDLMKPSSQCSSLQTISELLNELKTSSEAWTLKIQNYNICEKDKSVFIKLNRPCAFQNVLSEVVTQEVLYGRRTTGTDKSDRKMCILNNSAFLHDLNCDDMTLSQLRSVFLCEHIGSVLEANGYQVCNKLSVSDQKLQEMLQEYGIVANLDHTASISDFEDQLKNFKDKIEKCKYIVLDKTLATKHGGEFEDNPADDIDKDKYRTESKNLIFLDLRQFLNDNRLTIGKDGYDKNINNIQVFKEDGTSCQILSNCCKIEKHIELLKRSNHSTHSSQNILLVHVVNYEKEFSQQQVDLVCRMISDKAKDCQQIHCVYGPVIARKNIKHTPHTPVMSAAKYYQLRKSQMREAWVMKYGTAVKGEGWEATINAMTIAAIKFELLGTTARNSVKVDLSVSGISDSKGGSFVIYNCARLSTLLARYYEAVEQGLYPSLPDVASIDFSLLREEEEWQLLFNYILPYASLVRNCVGKIDPTNPRSKIHSHKICNFLVNLSRDFSSYYRRVHILTEPRPHLLPTMFARLHLMKAIQQVMKNAFTLLHITPLEQV